MTDTPHAAPGPGPDLPPSFEDLLVQALDQLESGGAAAAERFVAAHPSAAPRLRTHLERLQRMGLAGVPGGVFAPAAPERLGDFRIVEPLGHGGMGVVYRAVQESLGRQVALKLIRPDQLFFPGARERFRREVELVARMQHPGIVPIHAVGTDGGVPFFAMELVRGASLADVVERLAARRPARPDGAALDAAIAAATGDDEQRPVAELFAGSWVDVVLRIVRDVAEALEHAHRRGVLHRDVKPSNVMLTRDGRVLLLDFGLASAEFDERLTRSGAPLGSLAYMPPEVLAGDVTARDARSDVYSLGVTMWELLTLRLPYQHSDPLVVRDLARTATRPKLSVLDRTVSWDVETVVATAMDPEPARRYASARDFARDLDNLLAHRPIEAREPGAWLRLRRWAQRHPARATAAVSALLVLGIGPTTWAWQQSHARAGLERANELLSTRNAELDAATRVAESESARAAANFAKLQLAVDTMLAKVGDENLREVPRMELVRRDLLGEALRFYEGFLADDPADARLRLEAARVRMKAAEIHALLGDFVRAGAEIDAALAAFATLDTLDDAARVDLARARMRLATSKRLAGDLDGAAAAATAALAAWQQLPPDALATVVGHGEAALEASLVAADRGDLDGARAVLAERMTALDARGARGAAEPVVARLHARLLQRAAIWAFQAGVQQRDRTAGGPLVESAVDLHQRARALWAAAGADDVESRSASAHGGVNLCLALQRLGRFDDALDVAATVVPELERLAADFPHSQRRRSELANARMNYAVLLGQTGDADACARQLDAGMVSWRQLVAESPGNDDYTIGLAHALQTRATVLFYGGDPDAARPLFVEAGEATDRALAVRPDNPTYRRVRRKVWECLAEVGITTQHPDAAVESARGLLAAELAPTEPLLAAALIARCVPLAADGATGAAWRSEARALLQASLDRGVTVADWRKNPVLGGQWDRPGFQELVAEIEHSGIR